MTQFWHGQKFSLPVSDPKSALSRSSYISQFWFLMDRELFSWHWNMVFASGLDVRLHLGLDKGKLSRWKYFENWFFRRFHNYFYWEFWHLCVLLVTLSVHTTTHNYTRLHTKGFHKTRWLGFCWKIPKIPIAWYGIEVRRSRSRRHDLQLKYLVMSILDRKISLKEDLR